jgi:hypothetical protein
MFKTVSAVVIAVLISSASAFAAPNPKHHAREAHAAASTRVTVSGAMWWQNRGVADEMGLPYR